MDSLLAQEARSLKLRWQQGWLLPEGIGEEFVTDPLLPVDASCILDIPFLESAERQSLVFVSVSSHDHLSFMCVCVQILSSYKDTGRWIRAHSI
jgi:hypothetical protein